MQHSSEELLSIFFQKGSIKPEKEVSNYIKLLFGSPTILIQRIQDLKGQDSPITESGLDYQRIHKLYENIHQMKKDKQIILLYNQAFERLQNEADFKIFLKSSNQMKYFLIATLWDKLFINDQNRPTLFKLLELIQRSVYYHQVFTSWLADIKHDYFKFLLVNLNRHLNFICNSLVQPQLSQAIQRQLGQKSLYICNFMKLLYTSNKDKVRVPIGEFNNPFLTKFFQPVQQYKIYIQKLPHFNFVSYPFLLDFDYKYKLMQIESIFEQKNSIRQNMSRGLSAIIQDFDHGANNFSIEGLIYLYFAVNRDNILDDSMEKLGKIKQNLKSPLRIEFIGEEGTDQGGVKNEYFSLITKAIFNPYLDMFLPKNHGRFYWFNGYSYQIPLRFQFVGMLLALSLYNSVHLDIHFPEVIYKKLLTPKYQQDYGIQIIEDLKEIQPDVYRTLKDILTTAEDIDQLQLYFNIQLQSFGQYMIQELVQDGSSIKVSQDNREYYCLLYADYILNKHIAKQFAPFKKGFYKVVSGGIIDTFEPIQLRDLVSGIEEINMKQLQENTNYEGGYTSQTPVIKNLWEFLLGLNHEEKKNFLTFVTGTDRVPIDGLKSLKFLIQRHSNTLNLPTAHTCFNVLLLPEYQSKELLHKNIRLILQHNQGFGLI